MIVEKVEKGNEVNCVYDSSNIVASNYNKETNNLSVIFKSGLKYLYENVSSTDYFRFETADSQGKVLNTTIKKYTFLKEGTVDVNEISRKIALIKSEEVSKIKGDVILFLKEIVKTENLTIKEVDITQKLLADYKKLL